MIMFQQEVLVDIIGSASAMGGKAASVLAGASRAPGWAVTKALLSQEALARVRAVAGGGRAVAGAAFVPLPRRRGDARGAGRAGAGLLCRGGLARQDAHESRGEAAPASRAQLAAEVVATRAADGARRARGRRSTTRDER